MKPSPARSAEASPLAAWLPCAAAACVLAAWLAAKAALFDGLEYTSDLFSNLQMSTGVFLGRPLLWENGFGDHKALHNYYVVPLFFPLTRFFGPFGLFLGSALLWAAASFAVFRLAWRSVAWKRWMYWAFAACVLFGPVGAWFFDDPIYGWHADFLLLPLSVLLACALANRSRHAWWLALPIVLVREEAAIVLWGIHALWEWTHPRAPSARARLARIMRMTPIWLAIFACALGVQAWMRPAARGGSRAMSALAAVPAVLADPRLRQALGHSAMTALLLLAVALVVGVSWRAAVAAAAATLPLIPPLLVASCSYGATELGARDYSFSWGVRLVLPWSVVAAALLLAIAARRKPPAATAGLQALLLAGVVLVSLGGQALVLRWGRGYEVWQRATAFLGSRKSAFLSARLAPAEDQFLRCLGRELPRLTPVSSGGSLFARFYRQDIDWPDRLQTAWAQPALVACDALMRLPYDYGCNALARQRAASGFAERRVFGIAVAYAPALAPAVQRCAP